MKHGMSLYCNVFSCRGTDKTASRGNDWNETVDILKVVEDLLENLTSVWDQEFLQGDLDSKSAPTHISELCMPFFRSCANALALSEVAVTVELVHDEVYHFLDTIRFGVAHDKTSEYYDAMFLSNTPYESPICLNYRGQLTLLVIILAVISQFTFTPFPFSVAAVTPKAVSSYIPKFSQKDFPGHWQSTSVSLIRKQRSHFLDSST
jgi:hypothetical protein